MPIPELRRRYRIGSRGHFDRAETGLGEEEIGITALREAARRLLGDAIVPWYFSYRMRVGVK
jgi:hypothetical protein